MLQVQHHLLFGKQMLTAPLTLWEADVDCLIEGNTTPQGNTICWSGHFKAKNNSAPKHAAIVSDDDITDVASAESSDSDSDTSMTLQLKSLQFLFSPHIWFASPAKQSQAKISKSGLLHKLYHAPATWQMCQAAVCKDHHTRMQVCQVTCIWKISHSHTHIEKRLTH